MLPNIQAVYISDGKEYQGWLDLNRFLASPEPIDHWQIIYCLLFCERIVFQNIHFQCMKPIDLRNWLHEWLKTPVGQSLRKSYTRKLVSPGQGSVQICGVGVPHQGDVWMF